MATYWEKSGFMSTTSAPDRADPASWFVWHFTHIDNLPGIAAAGELTCDSLARPSAQVTDTSIKGRRARMIVVPDDSRAYPQNAMVSDHVPLYFAPRSPTLLRVVTGYNLPYKGGAAPLVLFGVTIADLMASTETWCFSDRNAAADIVRFRTDVTTLPDFIDFDLMREEIWRNTNDDPDRAARRAAEVLVYKRLPVGLISCVVASTESTLSAVQGMLAKAPGYRDFYRIPSFLYQD